MKGSELQALLTELLGQGAVIQRTSGYIVQGVALKAPASNLICLRDANELSLGAAMRSGAFLFAGEVCNFSA